MIRFCVFNVMFCLIYVYFVLAEDEVSIVVSQRSKAAAVDHTEQEGTFETKQSR